MWKRGFEVTVENQYWVSPQEPGLQDSEVVALDLRYAELEARGTVCVFGVLRLNTRIRREFCREVHLTFSGPLLFIKINPCELSSDSVIYESPIKPE